MNSNYCDRLLDCMKWLYITTAGIALRITRVYGLCPSPVLEDTTFRKLDLFPSSGEGRETPTLLGPLERMSVLNVIDLTKLYEDTSTIC
jgi:hypothetical protein